MRQYALLIITLFIGIIFTFRLVYLQIYNDGSTKELIDAAVSKKYIYPKRGNIFDRNGKLLVTNQPSYDIMVIPNDVSLIDTLLFCDLLGITKPQFKQKLKKAKAYSYRIPSVFDSQLTQLELAKIQEKIRRFSGFYIQRKSLRKYNTVIGANVLGDIGQVNHAELNKDSYYKQGDLIGKQGVESSYEKTLRGTKGVKYVRKNRYNQVIGSYKNGTFDTLAVPGKDITLTLDSKLQSYGELLMQNKRGGVIAIEPSTGEILAMVSAPTYDPNLLVGKARTKNFNQLYNDSLSKPFFNRSLQGTYPPGSPFKLVNALIGLQEGVINTKQKITCYKGFKYGNRFMRCHCNFGTKNNLLSGIQESCNAYFGTIYLNTLNNKTSIYKGVQRWSEHVKSFGFGNYLNNDLSVGAKGFIPDSSYYKRYYPNRFYSTYVVSNAIGQGQILTTPLQLANMTATIANRGHYFTPHIIKEIVNDTIPRRFKKPNHTTINPAHFESVVQGMSLVFEYGTAKHLNIPGIKICGKTGTVENFVKIKGEKTQLTDHSIFVAFAPAENPKIALAVFVENGYYGARFAGRIASLMIENYLLGEVKNKNRENWVLNHTLEHEYDKPFSGKPFSINANSKLMRVSDYEN